MLYDKAYPALVRLVDKVDENAVVAAFNVAKTHGFRENGKDLREMV